MRWAVLIAVSVMTGLLAGCQKVQYKALAHLPPPVFGDEAGQKVEPTAPPSVRNTYNGPRISPPGPQPRQSDPRVAQGEPGWDGQGRAWKYIIIHHSASDRGNAAIFNAEHLRRGWDGLGYHFVIGNGTNSSNGEVEIGFRWKEQKHGAHCKTNDNRYNEYGIGICLVGNFENTRPTAQQWASAVKLVSYLAERHNIASNRILGHGEAVAMMNEGRGTKCPGQYFDMDLLRQVINQRVAARP